MNQESLDCRGSIDDSMYQSIRNSCDAHHDAPPWSWILSHTDRVRGLPLDRFYNYGLAALIFKSHIWLYRGYFRTWCAGGGPLSAEFLKYLEARSSGVLPAT